MHCLRTQPRFYGTIGVIHVDVQEATVWFEGWVERPNSRTFERKEYDLRDQYGKYPCKQPQRT